MIPASVTIGEEAFLDVYKHTLEGDFDIEFYYGSRDSGKSRHIAQKLVLLCLGMRKFRCALIRKVANTVKDSMFEQIKEIVKEWGLEAQFDFRTSPLSIRCISGGEFLARGLDDPKKIKSLTSPTHAWIEEGSDLSEDDWDIITTSLRSNDYPVRIFYSFNPDVPGDFEEFWLYIKYFEGHEELTFEDEIVETLKEVMLNGKPKEARVKYRAIHSTFYDNPFCPPSRRATYEGLKGYARRVYRDGLWGRRKSGGEFYVDFDPDVNTALETEEEMQWNPEKPLHLTFDFNVNPFMTCLAFQFDEILEDVEDLEEDEPGSYSSRLKPVKQINRRRVRQIAEFTPESPNNRTDKLCRIVAAYFRGHVGKIFIYGDPAGRSQDTRTEQGSNDYSIITRELKAFRCQLRVEDSAPAVAMRGAFINQIFSTGFQGIELVISKSCRKSINDLTFLKQASDGTKLKKKVNHPVTGVPYEQYGHTSDAMDYFLCAAFKLDYLNFQRGGATAKSRIGKTARGKKNHY